MCADSRIRRNVETAKELQAEISYLKEKVSDLQQLVAELLMENQRMRQSCRLQGD
jgi:FtsZ-binding cell division protein ZapB